MDMQPQTISYRAIKFVFLFLAVTLWLAIGLPAQAPKPATAPPARKLTEPATLPTQPAAAPEMTAADVGAFLDGLMPLQLQRENIAGAVVLVAKDGKVLFAKGYGYADVAKKTPISPDGTLFRPGSVSKLFTWTAVMQLVEQGKIDLDRDVNDYIDFKIPPKDGKPITMRNLLTHTPGFEEAVQQLFVGNPKSLYPLGDYLKEHLPQRVYPAGALPAYSNYGATLAGYIVQRVSGEPFDDYIEHHIFRPLGMDHSTFRQPLPDDLKPRMSSGYKLGSGPAEPFELVEGAPAGSSSATASDMARFMIAHLQNGQYQGTQILRPETARLMHSGQFHLMPELNGMALGFYEETRNGHRIIGHGGDTEYFHSDLHLVLDANLGFFISYNSAGAGAISPRTAVWDQFLDRYFPYTPAKAAAVATASQDAQAVTGRYISDRRGETTLLNVLSAIGQTKVVANSDGTISISDLKALNGEPKKFREVQPMVFQAVDEQSRIGFTRDYSGRRLLVIEAYPFMAFQKARWYESSAFSDFLIVGGLVVFVLTLLFWPVGALLRRHYGQKLELDAGERRLRLLVRAICVLDILFLAGFVTFFYFGMKDIEVLSPRYNAWLRLIQLVGWLGVIGTLVALYNVFRSWATPQRWVWGKIGDTLIALACLGFAWFAIAWQMLSWSLRY